jgi:flagellar motor protein MotB
MITGGNDMITKWGVKGLVLMVLCTVGCASIQNSIVPANMPGDINQQQKVAVFPFADYSHQQDFLDAEIWGGNIRIIEEITDHLVVNGLSVAVQEDVNTMLVDNNIIQPIPTQSLLYGSGGDEKLKFRAKVMGTPEYDLVNVEHSEAMKEEIIEVIKDEMILEQAEKLPVQTSILQGATVGLTREMITQLGHELGVDLIIRGRIIDYGYKSIDTYNPLKRGFIPVLIEPLKDVLFGTYDTTTYESDLEDVDFSRLGEGVGFLFGQKSEDDVEGTWDLLMEHSLGTVSNLHPRKKNISTIVQIRIYAQDARTGDVIWSNRAETEYIPSTSLNFNKKHPKTMFDRNIEKCVKLLMDDFFRVLSRVTEVKMEKLEEKLAENESMVNELQSKIGTLEDSNKIIVQQVEDKTHINLPDAILFSSGHAALNTQGIETLKSIGEVLEGYPNRTICVVGHTDNVPIGSKLKDKYPSNWELSTSRSITVMQYMVNNFNFDQNLLAVKGYGLFKPVASNATSEGKSKNRRVVIVVGSKS